MGGPIGGDTSVPPLPEAPEVPTDADGNTRVDDATGVVDNSDGFLADATEEGTGNTGA